MALIDMKLTKKQAKKTNEPIAESTQSYPYGLNIRLEKEGLDKLNLDLSDFKIGEKVTVLAIAEISEISQREFGSSSKTLSLQIQKMGIKKGSTKKDSLDWDTSKRDAEKKLHEDGVI